MAYNCFTFSGSPATFNKENEDAGTTAPTLAARFTSTSVQTTVFGAQAISQVKIGDQAKA
jgi:hypothetical protein